MIGLSKAKHECDAQQGFVNQMRKILPSQPPRVLHQSRHQQPVINHSLANNKHSNLSHKQMILLLPPPAVGVNSFASLTEEIYQNFRCDIFY